MKHVSVLLFLIASSLLGHSQQPPTTSTSAKPEATFGVRVGGNFNKFAGKGFSGASLNNEFKVGGHIGINAEIPLTASLYFQPGFMITNKGSKNTNTFGGQTVVSSVDVNYVDIPLTLLYKMQLGSGWLLLGGGPYVAYGVVGHYKEKPGTTEKIYFTNEYKSADTRNHLRAFDAGINILAGYQFNNRIYAHFNGQVGLTKVNPNISDVPADKTKAHYVGLGLSVGYRFHSKK